MFNKSLFSIIFLTVSFLGISQNIEVITQEKSKGIISNIIYNPSGNLIAATGEQDPIAKIWDVKTEKIIGKLDMHEMPIQIIKFNSSGNKILTFALDKKVILWDIMTWEIIDSTTIVDVEINDAIFISDDEFLICTDKGNLEKWSARSFHSPDTLYQDSKGLVKIDYLNGKAIFANESGEVNYFNIDTKESILKNKIHSGKIKELKFYDNGNKIISNGGDGKIYLSDVKTLEKIKEFNTINFSVTAIAFNIKKQKVAVAGSNKVIKVFNFSGELLNEFNTKTDDENTPIKSIAISPDGTTLANSSFLKNHSFKPKQPDNTIQIWDIQRGALYKNLHGEVNPIYYFDFHPTENKLLTLGEDRILTFWDFETADKIGDFTLMEPKREIPPRQKTVTLQKGKKAGRVVKAIMDGNLNSPDLQSTAGTVLTTVAKRVFAEHEIIKYSAMGNYLFTKLPKDEIRMYDLKDRKPEYMKPLFSYQVNINGLMTSPDEKYLAVLGSGDSAVSVIDVQTGDFITKLRTPSPGGRLTFVYEANSMAFSPDGRYFAVCFNTSKTFVFDTFNGWQLVFENILPNNLGYAKGAFVNFTSDGKYMVINTMLGVKKYNTGTFNVFEGGLLNVSGTSIPLDKNTDFTVTVKDNILYFENVITGETTKSIRVNPHNISHVSVKSNGKFGITFKTGQFAILNPVTGVEEITIVANGDNYIVKTDENYYKVSKEGYNLVTFRIGNKAFPFEQFDAVYNRPDLVLKKLECMDEGLITLYEKAYQKRIQKLGLTPTTNISLSNIPTIEIKDHLSIPSVTKETKITLNFIMNDEKGLHSYNIWVNNVPLYGKQGKTLANKKAFTGKDVVELVSGMNKIQIACRNKDGYESLMETFFVEQTGEVKKPNLYLITIGTSNYKDTRYNLNYAVKDAKDLNQLIAANTKEVYGEIKTKSLYDEEVTTENVIALKSFVEQSTVNDVVMVFVAGHGVLDLNFDYYFATYLMDFSDPKKYGLAYEKLESLLDGIKAKKKILIMDTCHSGEIDKDEVFFSEEDDAEVNDDISFRSSGAAVKTDETKASPSKVMNEMFNDLRRGTGATVISSAGGAEYAMESSEWKNGLFTYCLLMGLKNYSADLDGNGKIELVELQTYVVSKVKALSHGKQIPNARMQNLELDFVVW